MMVRLSGEHQVNLNLSLTLVDVKLVLYCIFTFADANISTPASLFGHLRKYYEYNQPVFVTHDMILHTLFCRDKAITAAMTTAFPKGPRLTGSAQMLQVLIS